MRLKEAATFGANEMAESGCKWSNAAELLRATADRPRRIRNSSYSCLTSFTSFVRSTRSGMSFTRTIRSALIESLFQMLNSDRLGSLRIRDGEFLFLFESA
jgi:hypothetical protein